MLPLQKHGVHYKGIGDWREGEWWNDISYMTWPVSCSGVKGASKIVDKLINPFNLTSFNLLP